MTATGVLPGLLLVLQASGPGWQPAPSLPRPAAWNTAAAIEAPGGTAILGFLGEGPEEGGEGWVYRWDIGSETWTELTPVPGPRRLSATTVTAGGKVFLLGGRAKGGDESLTRVDVYDPASDTWAPARPMPLGSPTTVAGAWRDSLVYVIGAPRADEGPEVLVQIYDPASDTWLEGTPAPGSPVSSHAGTVARDAIVFLGRGEARSGPTAWRGDIDPLEPTRIRWRRLTSPDASPRFGAAAVGIGTRVLFVGGGRSTLIYDLVTNSWRNGPGPGLPTLAHGLVRAGGWLVLIGGMNDAATATDAVWRISVLDAIAFGG